MLMFRQVFRAAWMGLVVLAAPVLRAQEEAEAVCREHLEVLGAAYGRFLVITGGRPPARLSEFYTEGLVLDLDAYTCPATGNRITDPKQIDDRTHYTIATNLADRTPMLLVWEKHGAHGGQALSYYSDRTFRKAAAPPPPATPKVSPSRATDETRPADRMATNRPALGSEDGNGPAADVPNPGIDRVSALDALGREEYRKGHWAAAAAAFGEVSQLDPTNPWHPFNLGLALAQQGKWSEAEGAYSNAVRFNGSYAPARDQLGHALFNQSKWPPAEIAYREAIRLDPTNASFRAHLGATLRLLEKWSTAEASYRAASQLDPNNAPYHVELGHLCVQQGKWGEAEPQYREALRLDPNNAWAYGGLGHVWLAQNKLADAESSYRSALRLNPQYGQFSADLAGVLVRAGRVDEARAAAQDAIRLGYKQHWSYQYLGLTAQPGAPGSKGSNN